MFPSQAQSTTNALLRLSRRIDTQCAFFRRGTYETFYDVLGVPRNASHAEIRTAFIELSKKVHPDADSKDKSLHEKFVKINKAYSVLSKPSERKTYDEGLLAGFHVEPDEVSTTETWNPKQTQYYYHPRFYKDPEMRKKAEEVWYQNTGYHFGNYENQPKYDEPEHVLRKRKAKGLLLCLYLSIFGLLLGYRQYLSGLKSVKTSRKESAEIEERWKNRNSSRVVHVGSPVPEKKRLETKEADLSGDRMAGPATLVYSNPVKT